MKVLIIEDEKPAANKIKRLLADMDNNIQVLDVLESVEASVNWLSQSKKAELIFMDIQLSDGLCFEIFEAINIKTPVIFTTAYNEYALQAFKVNSIDYLLKPINSDDLEKAISKYKELYSSNQDSDKISKLLNQFQKNKKERFLIKVGDHYKSVQIDEINCFYVLDRCNFMHIGKSRSYHIDYSLDKIENIVDENKFFRISRNYIVNFYSIQDIIIHSSSRLRLKLKDWDEDTEIIVSRDRVQAFKNWMDR